MAIVVQLDRMLALRKMTSLELAERVGITQGLPMNSFQHFSNLN